MPMSHSGIVQYFFVKQFIEKKKNWLQYTLQ